MIIIVKAVKSAEKPTKIFNILEIESNFGSKIDFRIYIDFVDFKYLIELSQENI